MATKRADDLFPEVGCPPNTRIINEHCLYRRQDGNCVVIVAGIVLAQFAHNDPMAQAYAMVQLVEQGWANQNDMARAFGCCARTLRRHQRRFEEGGLAALGQHNGYPHGRPRVNHTGTALILQFKAAGYSNREIARRVGVSEMAIRKRLRRMGWNQAVPVQQTMALIPTPTANPNLSAFRVADAASDSVASLDRDPADRRSDRLLARLGLLEDAAPLFGSARAVTRAGVLLALPGLVHSGVFDCASASTAAWGQRSSACAPVC